MTVFEPAFTLTLQVEPADIDEMGHVNNVVYVRWVEAVARAHSDALGYDFAKYRELEALPVVRRHTITYHASALLGDSVDLHTRIAQIGGVRAIRQTRIERNGDPLAEAETEWVWVDPSTNRPKRIPTEVVKEFGSVS